MSAWESFENATPQMRPSSKLEKAGPPELPAQVQDPLSNSSSFGKAYFDMADVFSGRNSIPLDM